jgi:enoyl-CoA hydratase
MECSKPVVAAVNGHALGAGFALTLCCDILLAADDAIFAMPEVDVGLGRRRQVPAAAFHAVEGAAAAAHRPADSGGRVVSARRAGGMRAAGRTDAGGAGDCADIASKSPLATRMLKQSFNIVENLTLRDGYRIEQNMTVELSKSDDAKEAKRAFVEKRKPTFTGR